MDWVISSDTLHSMAHMSLQRRALIIKEKLGMPTLSPNTVRRWYMKYGVNYQRPKYTFWKSYVEKDELKKKQHEFVGELISIIKDRTYDEVIYIDETTFHLWQKASKCWVRAGMKLNMVRNRGPSITVIGAISQERGIVYFEVFEDNNNSDLFSNFIRGLKSKCEGRRVVLVLDNLRIHYTKKLDDVYDSDFKEMFLPTYSSELNPIETLWSLLKRKWIKELHGFCEVVMNERQLRKKENLVKRTIEKLKETIGRFYLKEIYLRVLT